jgi:hypothetical protein
MKGFLETGFSRTGFGSSKSAYERDIQGVGGVWVTGALELPIPRGSIKNVSKNDFLLLEKERYCIEFVGGSTSRSMYTFL